MANHDRSIAANRQLRDLLRRAVGFANGHGTSTERDLMAVLGRLLALKPEIGDASRGEILDAQLRDEIAEYVKNFRALQRTVEQIRNVMLARRMQLETARRGIDGLLGWTSTNQQVRQ
ncbi:MAG: hypothetical protein ABSA96_18715 [Candidatus Acidiferrales bacterium]|jgi:hypothetical protein